MAITTQMRTDVAGLYAAFFGRAPERDGLGYWVQQLDAGKTVAQVAQEMYNTEPARAFYPTFLTNEEVIARFYVNVLGRTADADGLAYWTAKLNAGQTKGSVIAEMITAVTSFAGTGTDDLSVAARTSKALFDNKVSVGLNYAVTLGLNDVAKAAEVLKLVTATDTTAANNLASGTSTAGQTLALTTGSDTVAGTAGNDTIKAATGLSADGTTVIATTNALDSIDGGAGTDTLVIENTGGKNTLIGTVTNVENLTFVGAGNVNNNTAVDVSSFSGTVTLSQTDDTAVSLSKVTTQTLALNKVADNTVLTAALDAAQTTASLTNVGAVGSASFNIAGATLATVSVSTDKTAATEKLTVTDTGNTTKTFNIAATGAAAVEVESTAVEAINVTGSGLVTLTTTATAPSKTLSSVNSTGGVSYATELGTSVVFTGGAGKDSVAFGATTKAQTLGAGDDTATISVDLGTGGSIDAGEGTDTLAMTATLAATLDNNTDFNAKVSNFEKLSVSAATNQTLNLANLDGLNYVIEAGTGNTLTIDNMVSGGTFEFTDTSTATAVNIKDAATGTADVLNVKLSAGATFAAGTLTAANVETVNINSDDTAATPAKDGTVKHTLTLTADKATSVVISGDAAVNLTLTGSTKVTSIDASANEAGIQTNLSVASGIALTGTAKADTITLGNLSVVTGGAGKDVYTLTTPTNGNTYATIADFVATETIQFTDQGDNANGAALGTKLSLATTAAFADYLAAAAAADGSTDGATKWFVYSGDTYVVHDISADVTFQNGADQIVKLTGVLDLSKSTVSAAGLLTFVAV